MSNKVILKHQDLKDVTKELENMDDIRFLNSCLVGQSQFYELDEEVYYQVDINYYSEVSGVSYGKGFSELVIIVERYKSVIFEIGIGKGKSWFTSLIYDYVIDWETKTISVKWNKKLIPLISGQMEAGTYTLYDKRASGLPTKRRYLLYEFIERNSYRFNRKPYEYSLPVEEFREEINCLDTYKDNGALKRSFIVPALEDIRKTTGIGLEVSFKRNLIIFRKEK